MATSAAPIAALDVGGTTIKPGVVRGTSVELLTPVPALAASDASVVLGQLATACGAAVDAAGAELVGVAIAVPRPFDLEAGVPMMRGLHKYDSIHGTLLRPVLRERTAVADRPIVFVGDAEAAAVGEARHGAGAAWRRVLTITLGTGMGACLTEAGDVVASVDGTVVEGMHELDVHGRRADDVFSVRGLADALGVPPGDLHAAVDDPANEARLEDFGRRFGEFLAPVLARLGADGVVVGGGLSGAFDRFGPSMGVPAARAVLGPRGPLLGAVALSHLAP